MRDFAVDLLAGLATEVTTAGWLLAIERRDGTVIRQHTMGPADYTFEGNTYNGYPGFNMGAVRFTDSLDPASVAKGTAADTLGPITFTDMVAGLYSGARVRLFLTDWSTGEGQEIGFKWTIGNITTRNNGETSFDIWSALRTNQALILKKYRPGCTTVLFHPRCGVSKAAWEDSVAVVTPVSAFSFTISGFRSEAQAADWFARGAIQFQDGANQGIAYDIQRSSFAAGVVTINLWPALRRPLLNGVTAKIVPGCDLTSGAAGCLKYSNNGRYQGFELLPDEQTQWGVEVTDTGVPPVSEPPPDWASGGGPITGGWGSW